MPAALWLGYEICYEEEGLMTFALVSSWGRIFLRLMEVGGRSWNAMTNYNGLLCLAGMECPVLLGRGFLFFCLGRGCGRWDSALTQFQFIRGNAVVEENKSCKGSGSSPKSDLGLCSSRSVSKNFSGNVCHLNLECQQSPGHCSESPVSAQSFFPLPKSKTNSTSVIGIS